LLVVLVDDMSLEVDDAGEPAQVVFADHSSLFPGRG
jgi:hypothetical protein